MVWKQVADTAQRLLQNGNKFYRICFPFSDCIQFMVDNIAVRIGIANALEFISILQQPLSCILNLFPYHLIPNLFAYFFHFQSLFLFFKKCKFLKSFLVFYPFICTEIDRLSFIVHVHCYYNSIGLNCQTKIVSRICCGILKFCILHQAHTTQHSSQN